MDDALHPDALDFAALLCSRVCHDLINPVGALANAAEMLGEEQDAETRALALDLVIKSAEQITAKLRFARLAFGAAGGEIGLDEVEAAAREVVETDRITLAWFDDRRTVQRTVGKLLLNLVLVAAACVPRGGRIAIEVSGDADAPRLRLAVSGLNVRIPNGVERLLRDGRLEQPVDVRLVQVYHARRLVEAAGMSLVMTRTGDAVTIEAWRPRSRG